MVGTGKKDDMLSCGEVVAVAAVVDRIDGGMAASLLIPENSALKLVFVAFQRNQEARGATSLAVVGQRHVTYQTSRYAQILHAKDGLMLAEH